MHGTVTVVYGLESGAGVNCFVEAGTFTPTAAPEVPVE
jgi:hypothetical protein